MMTLEPSNTSGGPLPPANSITEPTALRSSPPAAPIRHSQTAPTLSPEPNPSPLARSVSPGSMAATVMEDESKMGREICISPSWSEFGASKKKKERKQLERARKEGEKRQKKWDDGKGKKRLSKKPPAAMETQKLAVGRRRDSVISSSSSRLSSPGDSRMSARGERRWVEIPNHSGETRRSRSTPATSTDLSPEKHSQPGNTVNRAAPQLPALDGFGGHTRPSSARTGHTNSSADDGADVVDENEPVDVACRPRASTRPNTSGRPSPPHLTDRPASSDPATPAFNRSQTMPDLMDRDHRSSGKMKIGQRPGSKHEPVERRNHRHGDGTPLVVPWRPLSAAQAPDGRSMSAESVRVRPAPAPSHDPRGPPSPATLPHDGSSYVHKQRMHQQQLSIASFQDELAVQSANENHGPERRAERESAEKEGPSWGTSPTGSSKSSTGPSRQTSLECDCKADDRGDPDRKTEKHPGPSNDPAKGIPTPVTPASKTDRIFNFRPFHRKNKQPPSPVPPPDPKATAKHPVAASPPQHGTGRAGSARPKPAPTGMAGPEPHESHASPPPEVGRPVAPSHSRARTSSSQVLTDGTFVNRHVRRPSTAPSAALTDPPASSASPAAQPSDAPDDLHPSGNVSPTGTRSDRRGESVPGVGASPQDPPAVIVEGVNGEGLVHQTSIKRHRSNPMLHTYAKPSSQLPALDFLPELKHQPLIKPKRTSPLGPPTPGNPEKGPFPATTPAPVPSSPLAHSDSRTSSPTRAPEPGIMPRSPLRLESNRPPPEGSLLRPGPSSRRRTMSPSMHANRPATMGPLQFGKGGSSPGLEAKPLAKLFVICCKCHFWHDLPSRLYEMMALPQKLSRADEPVSETALGKAKQATLDTMVKCPWCTHYMTTWCCAGWTTVVYMHERHH